MNNFRTLSIVLYAAALYVVTSYVTAPAAERAERGLWEDLWAVQPSGVTSSSLPRGRR